MMNTQIKDTFIAPPCEEHISILYQDEHILVIDKPSGLLSLSGKNPRNYDSVHFRLAQLFSGITLVHRLDFGTSGVMVLALNKAANAHLTKQFQNRSVVKTYISILHGHLQNECGEIEAPIAKDPTIFPRLKVCKESGKPAFSSYEVLHLMEGPSRSRVVFTPKTGRTHQLRIHSAFIGHPILGCDLYGNSVTQSMAPRMLLHAASLTFAHPCTGEIVRFESAPAF